MRYSVVFICHAHVVKKIDFKPFSKRYRLRQTLLCYLYIMWKEKRDESGRIFLLGDSDRRRRLSTDILKLKLRDHQDHERDVYVICIIYYIYESRTTVHSQFLLLHVELKNLNLFILFFGCGFLTYFPDGIFPLSLYSVKCSR